MLRGCLPSALLSLGDAGLQPSQVVAVCATLRILRSRGKHFRSLPFVVLYVAVEKTQVGALIVSI